MEKVPEELIASAEVNNPKGVLGHANFRERYMMGFSWKGIYSVRLKNLLARRFKIVTRATLVLQDSSTCNWFDFNALCWHCETDTFRTHRQGCCLGSPVKLSRRSGVPPLQLLPRVNLVVSSLDLFHSLPNIFCVYLNVWKGSENFWIWLQFISMLRIWMIQVKNSTPKYSDVHLRPGCMLNRKASCVRPPQATCSVTTGLALGIWI